MKKKVSVSISDFAVPAPRKGSIDLYSGFGRAQELGTLLHKKIQGERKATHESYQAEVFISECFDRDGFQFEISGRMDGLFASDPLKIEEIKSSFNIYELHRHLREIQDDHPYCLQLKTYGYFYWLQNKKTPELNLHLISSRDESTMDFESGLNIGFYEDWLERRLKELVEEAKLAEKRAARRRRSSKRFSFPFKTPRLGQIELIETIEQGMEEKRPMLIQAPTGLGKTIGVLYPVLREALSRGQRTIYITPKNSQHLAAEDAIERLQKADVPLKTLTLTAKSKICMKNEPLCKPEFCEYAKDHYTKVAEHKLLDQLSKKRSLTARTFKKMAKEFEVCPFELQLDAAHEADTVICDYNYVFAPRSALGRIAGCRLDQQGKPNLIIDEAHNLPSRAMDFYSPMLSSSALESMRTEILALPKRFRSEAISLLNDCLSVLKECRHQDYSEDSDSSKPRKITPPVESFLAQDEALRQFLAGYLQSDADIFARDVVLRLCFYWSEFTSALEFVTCGRKEFFTSFHPTPPTIKITCCDASEMLEKSYDDYEQVVGFSATLKPFDFYSRLVGLEKKNLKTAEFQSPFPKANRKLLVIPQLSSKFSQREKNYSRIAEAIMKITALKIGNYFAFFPSFDFLNRVLEKFQPPNGFQVLQQVSGMRKEQIEEFISILKTPNCASIIFAVQGGVFAEGVDYPGEMIIGSFIVGTPLPSFNLEREKMREYYQENYSAGFEYAYTYPAMAKAVQAAGRVIRSETDKGIIVLMDPRFIEPTFTRSMPKDWYEVSPKEMLSKSILSDLANFWSSTSMPLKSDFFNTSDG